MDADGLPIVGPGIDYTKVGAIHQKRTLAFLNHFVTHTARFLNRFSCVCEEKLADLSVRLQRLDTTLAILEAKLSSIPGLENVTAPASSSTGAAAGTQQQQQQGTADSGAAASAATSTSAQSNPSQNADEASSAAEPEKPVNTVSQDPRFAKYFKMLLVGVPAQAIKMKMSAEGLDPSVLDTPDAAAPAAQSGASGGGGRRDQEDSDDTDFSEDDVQKDSDSASSMSDFSD